MVESLKAHRGARVEAAPAIYNAFMAGVANGFGVGQASCLPVRAASLPPVTPDVENTGQGCPVNRQAGCLPHAQWNAAAMAVEGVAADGGASALSHHRSGALNRIV
jgi:hypothetical protein